MEFADAVRRRRMVRSFEDRALPPGALDRMLDNAVRAPSAGFSQGWAFLVLEGHDETERFWAVTFDGDRRRTFGYPGLFRAPVLIVPLSHKEAYLARYSEPDKADTGLGHDERLWPVPYWDIDTGMATLLILLTAVDEGLGALFFGIFADRVARFRAEFRVPDEFTPIGAVAVGYSDGQDAKSPSLRRGRRGADEVVHRGSW